jgi:hypothetical protein
MAYIWHLKVRTSSRNKRRHAWLVVDSSVILVMASLNDSKKDFFVFALMTSYMLVILQFRLFEICLLVWHGKRSVSKLRSFQFRWNFPGTYSELRRKFRGTYQPWF